MLSITALHSLLKERGIDWSRKTLIGFIFYFIESNRRVHSIVIISFEIIEMIDSFNLGLDGWRWSQ